MERERWGRSWGWCQHRHVTWPGERGCPPAPRHGRRGIGRGAGLGAPRNSSPLLLKTTRGTGRVFYSNNSFVVSFFSLVIWRLLIVNPIVIIYLVKAQNLKLRFGSGQKENPPRGCFFLLVGKRQEVRRLKRDVRVPPKTLNQNPHFLNFFFN